MKVTKIIVETDEGDFVAEDENLESLLERVDVNLVLAWSKKG